ncbi:hypothetical protein GCM10011351_06920 [Paraliobacillus quinghaiensis]|uniref:Uncharacterized protein n=1 Tax=Paraliobacillus quinghaiensis TaxID=470815 RepID=A0A917THU9_9BACI|nr:hypothetical protein [Paraliobacillus quinghaiensis]GGM23737.1 hypothetical protein GCM10011351_06920 [Paraliobacillus quinghaiensis]
MNYSLLERFFGFFPPFSVVISTVILFFVIIIFKIVIKKIEAAFALPWMKVNRKNKKMN